MFINFNFLGYELPVIYLSMCRLKTSG